LSISSDSKFLNRSPHRRAKNIPLLGGGFMHSSLKGMALIVDAQFPKIC